MRSLYYGLVSTLTLVIFFLLNGCAVKDLVGHTINNFTFKNDIKQIGKYPHPTLPKDYNRPFLGTTAYFMELAGEGEKISSELHKDIEKAAQYYLNELAPNTQLFYTLSPAEFTSNYTNKSPLKKNSEINYVLAAKIEFFGTISGEERINLLNEHTKNSVSYKDIVKSKAINSFSYKDIVKSKAMICSLSVSLHRKIGKIWGVVASGKGDSKFSASDVDCAFYNEAYKDSYKGQYKTRDINDLDRVKVIKVAVNKALLDLLPKIVTELGIKYDKNN